MVSTIDPQKTYQCWVHVFFPCHYIMLSEIILPIVELKLRILRTMLDWVAALSGHSFSSLEEFLNLCNFDWLLFCFMTFIISTLPVYLGFLYFSFFVKWSIITIYIYICPVTSLTSACFLLLLYQWYPKSSSKLVYYSLFSAQNQTIWIILLHIFNNRSHLCLFSLSLNKFLHYLSTVSLYF